MTDAAATALTSQQTYQLDQAHVFSLVVGAGIAQPHGQLVRVEKATASATTSTPRVVAPIQEQAARLCTIAPQHANDQRSLAAHPIAELAPTGLDKVFFT
ncbi:MAG TPA: hypothetical protein VFY84_11215, partial [Jiangellales bacterium]|nr:hypothetical protein [Jiangellales bacterium]